MYYLLSLSLLFRSKIRITSLVILFGLLLLLLTACGEKAPEKTTPVPSPEVIITAYASAVIGEILNVDGCIRIRSKDSNTSYALIWPPDVSATIEGDSVRIITGIVRKKPAEVVLHFGDMAFVGGGETAYPDEQLLKELPPNCQGPYWVVGFEVTPYQPTEEP